MKKWVFLAILLLFCVALLLSYLPAADPVWPVLGTLLAVDIVLFLLRAAAK